MSNHQNLTVLWKRAKLTEKAQQKKILATSGAGQSKTTKQFITDLLLALQSKRGFKEFAVFVANNSAVQQKLKESPDKISVRERFVQFVQVGKEHGYEFKEKDVKEIFGEVCNSSSMEELVSKLVDWSNGGIQQFLTDIKNEPGFKKELDKIRERNNFVTFLKDTFNQPERNKKYQWLTERDIEEAANLIPSEEKKPEPGKSDERAKERIVGIIWS